MSQRVQNPKSGTVIYWPDAKAEDFGQWPGEPAREVTTLSIGPSPGQQDDEPVSIVVPDDFALRLPKLTHLYLWRIQGLVRLPALPEGLRCLDVRGCEALRELPPLPAGLEVLDLGDCTGLAKLSNDAPRTLQRFFFNNCPSLKPRHVEGFIESLRDAPVVEIDGSGTQAVITLENYPAALRKLVLKGCAKLADASRLAELSELDHLNLSGCTALEDLPDLPPKLRYLVLQGADNLRRFMGQDIGPYDRGTAENENVLKTFQSRRKFGEEIAASAHAKLLLLGDGRVGKSTLAKRLLWESLSPAQRKDPAHESFRPNAKESPNHKMRFWRWESPVTVPEQDRESLRERAEARNAALELSQSGELTGAIRVWDFGGQEIYHNTHRVFAGEGSVFLLVWRELVVDEAQLERECPEGVTLNEWREWNRQRPLDYWLDYIDSVRPNAKVALVCSCCGPAQRQMPWTERAPRHRDRDLRCFYVDSLRDDCGAHADYRKLVEWLKTECGAEAARIGILQPSFFGQVADQVDAMLKENDSARQREEAAPHLLLDWEAWKDRVIQHHGQRNLGLPLNDDDVEAITGHLHDAGQLFRLQRAGQTAVLVDQEWATGILYEMLRPGGSLHHKIVRRGGWISQTDLESDLVWRSLEDDLQRERLLGYLEECRVLVKVVDQEESRVGQTLFLANEKWLLPTEKEVASMLEDVMTAALAWPDAERRHLAFPSGLISEFEFRDLMAHLGRVFGANATWFRQGLQAAPSRENPAWVFRLRWVAATQDGFLGTVEVGWVCRQPQAAEIEKRLTEALTGTGSPLARLGSPSRRTVEPGEAASGPAAGTRAKIGGPGGTSLRAAAYEVGVSSSGADKALAGQIVQALVSAGIHAAWYRLPECRSDDSAKVMHFMEHDLRRARCVVVILSDAYLRGDPETNWYCPWELADAINQWKEGKRTIAQTVVTYVPGQQVTSGNIDRLIAPLFERFADFFGQAYTNVPVAQRLNFKYYDRLADHFSQAWQGGRVGDFHRERGTLGTYPVLPQQSDGSLDDSAVVAEVRKVLRTTPAG